MGLYTEGSGYDGPKFYAIVVKAKNRRDEDAVLGEIHSLGGKEGCKCTIILLIMCDCPYRVLRTFARLGDTRQKMEA